MKQIINLVIATPPDGELVTRPGVLVGKGLAIASVPIHRENDKRGYSITHLESGYRIGDYFYDQRLAIRCAKELIRLMSFEGDVEECQRLVKPIRDESLYPLLNRYADYDQRVQEGSGELAALIKQSQLVNECQPE